METRNRRLARLTRLLEQRLTAFDARRGALESEARQIQHQRQSLMDTVDAGLTTHGLFVDLLAGRMRRLDIESSRVERQIATVAAQIHRDACRARVVERLQANAARIEERERAKRELLDLIDERRAAPAASFPKG